MPIAGRRQFDPYGAHDTGPSVIPGINRRTVAHGGGPADIFVPIDPNEDSHSKNVAAEREQFAAAAGGVGAYDTQYAHTVTADNSAIMRQLDHALQGIASRREAAHRAIATLPTTVAANYQQAQGAADTAALQGATGLSSDIKVSPAIGAQMQAALKGNAATSAATQPFLTLAADARADEGTNQIEAQRAQAAYEASRDSASATNQANLAAQQHAYDVENQNRQHGYDVEKNAADTQAANQQAIYNQITHQQDVQGGYQHDFDVMDRQADVKDPNALHIENLPGHVSDADIGRVYKQESPQRYRDTKDGGIYKAIDEEAQKKIKDLRSSDPEKYQKAIDKIIGTRKPKGGFTSGDREAEVYRALSIWLYEHAIGAPQAAPAK